MLTWNTDRFDALQRIRSDLEQSEYRPLYAHYISYLDLRQRGLRKQSFVSLETFVSHVATDPFEVRLSICRHLVSAIEGYWSDWPASDNWQLPDQIGRRLIDPVWREWREREPTNPEAWVYYFGSVPGEPSGREIAFLLAPTGPRYQYAFLSELGHKQNYELHELDHIERILCEASYFGELTASVSAVAGAMGENITPEAAEIVTRLTELAVIYRNHDRTSGTLLHMLRSLGRHDLVELFVLPARRWFRVLPEPVR